MSDPFQLLLIGAGRMGLTHLRAMAGSPRVHVAALVDPTPAARARATEIDPAVRTYAALHDALAAGSVDGVLIAAPSTLHSALVSACAGHGLPILCEKPCGTSIADIDSAAAAAEAAGILLQVGYWRRFVPELRSLREQLHDGRFGELLMISSWQWDANPPPASFEQASGGLIVDMAVHELDMIRWLTGAELAFPNGTPGAGSLAGGPDCASLMLELSAGGVAFISVGRYFPHGDCVWLELMGTRDHARIEVLWGERGDRVFSDALRRQAEDFARQARSGGVGPGAGAADARRALELAGLAGATNREPAGTRDSRAAGSPPDLPGQPGRG